SSSSLAEARTTSKSSSQKPAIVASTSLPSDHRKISKRFSPSDFSKSQIGLSDYRAIGQGPKLYGNWVTCPAGFLFGRTQSSRSYDAVPELSLRRVLDGIEGSGGLSRLYETVLVTSFGKSSPED